jgi:signal peptidase I
MNDEQSGPDRLSGDPGSQDLGGAPERSGSPAGYRDALSGDVYSRGATAQPAYGGATAGAGFGGATASNVFGDPSGNEGGGAYQDAPTAQFPTAQVPPDEVPPGQLRRGGGIPPGEPPPGELPPGELPAGQSPEEQAAAAKAAVRRKNRSTWRELPILIVVALAIALVIKTFVVQPFFIPSSSMEDTLMVGDKVLVNKLVYHFRSIQPGDIIVFNGVGSWNTAPPPSKPASDPVVRAYDATLRPLFHAIAGLFGTPVGQTDYIKRVIGTPGDRVACCNRQGLVTVNGVPLHESSYLFPGAAPSEMHFSIVVPPGRLWVMGDNRAVSDDSRLRQSDPGHGTIPENEVIGRAFVVVWPPSQWKFLPIPSTFNQPGVDRPASASAAARLTASERAAEATLLGAKVQPEPSYLPVAAGVVAAVPLTWLQRRTRQRLMRKLRARRGKRSQ